MSESKLSSAEAAAISAEIERLNNKIRILGEINTDLYLKYMKASNDLKWYEENTKEKLLNNAD